MCQFIDFFIGTKRIAHQLILSHEEKKVGRRKRPLNEKLGSLLKLRAYFFLEHLIFRFGETFIWRETTCQTLKFFEFVIKSLHYEVSQGKREDCETPNRLRKAAVCPKQAVDTRQNGFDYLVTLKFIGKAKLVHICSQMRCKKVGVFKIGVFKISVFEGKKVPFQSFC